MKKMILMATSMISMISMTLVTTSCQTTSTNNEPKSVSAVVIGMEKSAFAGSCPGAHIDATRMAEAFRSRYSDVVLLENQKATKSAVKKALINASSADFMILFYSGHGGSQKFKDTGPEEIDGQDEFLCLYDTYFRDNEIWDIVSQCKGRVWLIFDCCHSETMFRSAGFSMKMMNEIVLPLSDTMSMLCWSGCADDTYSYGDSTGGVFTDAFFRNLTTNATYKTLWARMSADNTLKSYEIIKQTKIGNGFDSKKVFE